MRAGIGGSGFRENRIAGTFQVRFRPNSRPKARSTLLPPQPFIVRLARMKATLAKCWPHVPGRPRGARLTLITGPSRNRGYREAYRASASPPHFAARSRRPGLTMTEVQLSRLPPPKNSFLNSTMPPRNRSWSASTKVTPVRAPSSADRFASTKGCARSGRTRAPLSNSVERTFRSLYRRAHVRAS